MCAYVFLWYRPDGELTPLEVAEQYADRAFAMVAPLTTDEDEPWARPGMSAVRC